MSVWVYCRQEHHVQISFHAQRVLKPNTSSTGGAASPVAEALRLLRSRGGGYALRRRSPPAVHLEDNAQSFGIRLLLVLRRKPLLRFALRAVEVFHESPAVIDALRSSSFVKPLRSVRRRLSRISALRRSSTAVPTAVNSICGFFHAVPLRRLGRQVADDGDASAVGSPSRRYLRQRPGRLLPSCSTPCVQQTPKTTTM